MTALPIHAHRPAAIATLAVAALLTACNYGPGATTQPTNPPSGQPSAQPSSPPTPSGPTPTPSPSPSPTFGAGQIPHPTGANDIVLRMEQGGGFVPMGFLVTQAPTFTLYGDGTVIFQSLDQGGNDPFGNQAYRPWLVGHLDEESVQALLQYALSTGRLQNARENYDNPMIADASTTFFNLNANGEEKVVTVYALAEMLEPGPDAADRAGFLKLAEVLRNFQTQDGLGELTDYDAAKYRVTLMETFGAPVGEVLEWPWDDLTLADFPKGDEGTGIAHLDKEHVAKLLEVPNGGHPGVWVEAPDGKVVQFGVRPLLPEEVAGTQAE